MTLTPRDKRMLQILGGVVGVAVVFLLVTKVFGGGGGGGEAALPTGSSGTVVPTSPSLSPTPTPAQTLPPVVLAGARDPFSIPPGLAVSSASSSPGSTTSGTTSGAITTTTSATVTTQPTITTTTTSSTTTTTTTTTTTSPTTTTTTTTTTSPGGGGGGDGDNGNPPPSEITIGGHDLRLAKVDGRRHRVEINVDHKLWTVEVGATFDQTFKLVKIDGDCARFLYGDQSFTLCSKTKN